MQKQTDSYSFAQISPLGAHDYVALFSVSLNLIDLSVFMVTFAESQMFTELHKEYWV